MILRFIEYMDVGHSNGWRLDEVVPAAEIVAAHRGGLAARAGRAELRGEVAERWRYRDGGGEFGVIASVTQPFCRDCTRARLSAEGKLYTCLFARRRATTFGPSCAPARSDAELAARSPAIWRRATTATPSSASAATSSACPRSRCSRWAAEAPSRVRSSRSWRVVHSLSTGHDSWIAAAAGREVRG